MVGDALGVGRWSMSSVLTSVCFIRGVVERCSAAVVRGRLQHRTRQGAMTLHWYLLLHWLTKWANCCVKLCMQASQFWVLVLADPSRLVAVANPAGMRPCRLRSLT